MSDPSTHICRRSIVRTGLAALACLGLPSRLKTQDPGRGHENGINPPLRVPDVPVRLADGTSAGLRSLLASRATALHFMFAGCRTVCPIQGAVFHRVQQLLPDMPSHSLQLLSLSVDPEADFPEKLVEWLKRYKASPGWTAAAPDPHYLMQLRSFFGDTATLASHGTRVHIVDRQGRWIWRTYDMPSAETVALLLQKMMQGRA